MNYVKQAYALEDAKRLLALEIYKDAVRQFARKDYIARDDDAHVDLSALFGERWIYAQDKGLDSWLDAKLFAEANVAFNYANFTLGISGRFVALAKELVEEDVRVDDAELNSIAKQMNCMLTATTEEVVKNGHYIVD